MISPLLPVNGYNEIYRPQYGILVGGQNWIVENNQIHRLIQYNRNSDSDYTRVFGDNHILRYNSFHGSTPEEIGTAHVDCLQFFNNNGEYAQNITISYNVFNDYHQVFMGECAHAGNTANWSFDYNIGWPTWGAWGSCTVQIPGVRSVNCTYYGMKWFGIGIRGERAKDGVIRNNIISTTETAMNTQDASPTIEYNLMYQCNAAGATSKDLVNVDPKMVDPAHGNFRLQKGSPAIGAGADGATIGALEYPNVYYVDPRHPAATDEGFGYVGRPFKTLTAALANVRSGETIILRDGTYRELLVPAVDGITIRSMKDEKVIFSGANVITYWFRQGQSWRAELRSQPRQVLRDGQPFNDFTYERGTISVKSDPRLHLFETIVRDHAIDLTRKPNVKVEGLDTANTHKEPVAGK